MTAYIQALAMLLIPIGLGFLAYAANIVGQPSLWKESISYIVAGIIAISFGGIVLKKVLKRVQAEEDEKKAEKQKREQDRQNMQTLIGEVKGLRQDLRNRGKRIKARP